MTVLTLSPYQLWYNGLTMGAGTPFTIQSIDGLKDLPPVRSQDSDRGYLDGSFSGQDFLSGRSITVNMIILAGNGNSAQTNADLLKQALMFSRSGVKPLQFQLSQFASLQFCNARARIGTISINENYSYGYIVAQFKFFCPDPLIFDNTQQTATLLAQNPNGRTFNTVYPLSYGGGVNAGTGLVANNGNTDAYPVITITGPCVNPVIGNATTGLSMYFNVTLNTGDTLVIDLRNRTILLNGNPARNYLSGLSKWFSAPVGNSTFFFTASGASGTTSGVVAWYNSYV